MKKIAIVGIIGNPLVLQVVERLNEAGIEAEAVYCNDIPIDNTPHIFAMRDLRLPTEEPNKSRSYLRAQGRTHPTKNV